MLDDESFRSHNVWIPDSEIPELFLFLKLKMTRKTEGDLILIWDRTFAHVIIELYGMP